MANACKYHVHAFWNGNDVINGTMSGVMVVNAMQSLVNDFAGATRVRGVSEVDDLLVWMLRHYEGDNATDKQINLLWGDETGSACVRVTRL